MTKGKLDGLLLHQIQRLSKGIFRLFLVSVDEKSNNQDTAFILAKNETFQANVVAITKKGTITQKEDKS